MCAASTGTAMDDHWFDDIVLSSEALLDTTSVDVEVTLNGQQFTGGGVSLAYDAPIVVSSFSPTSGPL